MAPAGRAATARLPDPIPRAELVMPVFDTPPWAYFDGRCQPQGVAVDVVRALAEGADLLLDLRPEGEVLAPVEAGGGVLAAHVGRLIQLSAHPARPGMVALPMPVFEITLGVLPARGERLERPEDLFRKRVAYDADEIRVRDALTAWGALAQPYDDYAGLTDALADGRVDAIAGLYEGLVYALRAEGQASPQRASILTLDRQPVWVHIEAGLPEPVRVRLAASVDAFLRSGRYASLRERHLSAAASGRLVARRDCLGRR
jgi:ABC-type amino acid transport substrate-binding protein